MDFEINDSVIIAVLKVDRRPTDPPNIVCIVVEKKKLYKLGDTHGVVKVWYGSDCLRQSE